MFRPRFGSGSSTNGSNIWSGTNSFNFIRLNATDTFINAVATSGILFGTTESANGIEFLTSSSGSGSGVRTRATSSGWLVDVRSNSGTWSNAVKVDFNGNITSGDDTIGGTLFLRGNFDNYVACYRQGTLLWFSGTASNYGFSTDWVVYNATTSSAAIRVNNATNIVTFNGQITASQGIVLSTGTGMYVGSFFLYSTGGTTSYLRDTVNARMQITFNPGNSSENASAVFSCAASFEGTVTLQNVNCVTGTTTGTIWGAASNQKQAWWGAAPVVQQVLAAGAGASVDDVITKLQLIGLFKQA